MSQIYPGGDHQISPNLGLALWGIDEVTTDNFLLIDTAFGTVGGSIQVNGSVVNNPNFIDSASVTFSVIGSNVSLTSSASGASLVYSPQTGTLYVILDGDKGKYLTFSNTSPVSVTLPQAGTAGQFAKSWFCYVENLNTGLVTITPTVSTINTFQTIVLAQFQSAIIVSDGTNYVANFTKISSTDPASALSSYVFNDAGIGAAQNQIVMRNMNTGVNSKRKGLNIYLEHDGAQASANYDGLQVNVGFTVDANTSASNLQTDAIEAYVAGSGSGQTIAQLTAVKTRVSVLNGATVTNAVGFLLYLPTVDATSTVSNYYGFLLDTPSGGGTVTNWCGMAVTDPGVGVVTTNSYGAAVGGKSGALLADISSGGNWGTFSHIGHADLHGNNMPFTLKDGWYSGNGTPEGSMTAVVGSIASRLDGGAGTSFYVKESGSGNTGWKAVLTTSSSVGTVTSFSAGTLSPLFTTSVATPTTTPALTFSLSTQNNNLVFAGPTSGGPLAPTFRNLVAGDIPTLNQNTTGTASNLSGTPALPNGTTATTQSAGDNTASLATDAFVTTAIANAIAAVNPAVAVLAATTGSNLVGTYTQVGGGIGDTFTVTATGAFSLDGVAINTIGQRVLLKDQTLGQQNGVYFASVVGASLVSPVFTRALDYDTPSDVNNTGSIPVQSGTVNAITSWLLTSQVTSVGSSGSVLTYAEFSVNPTATQTANTIYAGPTSGAAAAPTFRALVAADIPWQFSLGGFFGGNINPYNLVSVPPTASPTASANQVFVFQFTIEHAISIANIVCKIAAGNGNGDLWGYGIYSSDGNTKIIDSGAISTAAAGLKSTAITPVILNPGTYFYAQTSSNINATSPYTATEVATVIPFMNQNRQRVGLAANASVAGVLPATLGAISNTVRDPMLVWFEN